ncbi:copper resistance D family protein [Paenibacillus flagellatus]|nr:CopD family protein [Paenibacillus flagellatus]
MYVYVSETLLYLCFSLVTAAIVLNFIPDSKKPDIRIPDTLLFNAVVGIAVLAFVPVAKNTIFLTQFAQMSFWDILPDVLRDLAFGQAWVWMIVISTLFLALLAFANPKTSLLYNAVAACFTLALLLSYGWASHAAGQSESWGFWAQTLHLLAVSVWIGIMLAAGWFAQRSRPWLPFLQWFSPVSVVSVLVVIAAGLVMMAYIVPDYYDAWIISYGQALLIKHLLFIPLLVFGLLNGFVLKRKIVADPAFDPRPWLRAESAFAFLIFAVTAFLGFQRPPHDDPENPEPLTPSPLFEQLYNGEVPDGMDVSLGWNIPSVGLGVLSVALLLLMAAARRKTPWMTACFGLLFVAAAYLSLMLAVR